MTAGERLVALSGLGSATAAAHLLAIGSGATAGAALVAYSGLASGSAAAHLLTDVAAGGTRVQWLIRARRRGRR